MGRWGQGPLQKEGKEGQTQKAQLLAEAQDPEDAPGLGVLTSSCSDGT